MRRVEGEQSTALSTSIVAGLDPRVAIRDAQALAVPARTIS